MGRGGVRESKTHHGCKNVDQVRLWRRRRRRFRFDIGKMVMTCEVRTSADPDRFFMKQFQEPSIETFCRLQSRNNHVIIEAITFVCMCVYVCVCLFHTLHLGISINVQISFSLCCSTISKSSSSTKQLPWHRWASGKSEKNTLYEFLFYLWVLVFPF